MRTTPNNSEIRKIKKKKRKKKWKRNEKLVFPWNVRKMKKNEKKKRKISVYMECTEN